MMCTCAILAIMGGTCRWLLIIRLIFLNGRGYRRGNAGCYNQSFLYRQGQPDNGAVRQIKSQANNRAARFNSRNASPRGRLIDIWQLNHHRPLSFVVENRQRT